MDLGVSGVNELGLRFRLRSKVSGVEVQGHERVQGPLFQHVSHTSKKPTETNHMSASQNIIKIVAIILVMIMLIVI